MSNRTKMITTEREPLVLARLAVPMIAGILGMSIFNLADTFFVGRLGTVELAALSFTFPIVLIVSSAAHGLGVGMTAAVSKAAGMKDIKRLRNIISWGLVLSLLIVTAVTVIGQLTIEPVFRALGADEQTLPEIKKYMRIWYVGAVFVVIPMTGNAAIRGLGDTRLPSTVMLTAAAINIVLDPLLIFGFGPIPALGVQGAAIATVGARFTTFIVAMVVLIKREKVISFAEPGSAGGVWKELLFVGLPNTLIKLIIPLGTAIITRMIASYGREAVAGFGVAGKLEMFALIPLMAMTAVIPIFTGQNLGAGKKQRVLNGLKYSGIFSAAYGAGIYILLLLSSRFIAGLFNDDERIIETVVLYLLIVPAAYCFRNLMDLSVTVLSVTSKPIHAAGISLIQMFAIYIPLATAGSRILGLSGIFGALAVSLLICGPSAFFLTHRYIKTLQI